MDHGTTSQKDSSANLLRLAGEGDRAGDRPAAGVTGHVPAPWGFPGPGTFPLHPARRCHRVLQHLWRTGAVQEPDIPSMDSVLSNRRGLSVSELNGLLLPRETRSL